MSLFLLYNSRESVRVTPSKCLLSSGFKDDDVSSKRDERKKTEMTSIFFSMHAVKSIRKNRIAKNVKSYLKKKHTRETTKSRQYYSTTTTNNNTNTNNNSAKVRVRVTHARPY